MENLLIYATLAVSAVSLAIGIYVAVKIKAILYLLEQPVVKKLSPQLKLKPVKLEDAMDRNRQNPSRPPQNFGGQNQGQRPPNQHGHRPHGDRQEFEKRPDQGRDRHERHDRQDRPDRRPERGEGDRNRNNDRDRFRDRNRMDRGPGGDRGRPRENEIRESAPIAQEPPRFETPAPAPVPEHSMAPLSPRRPLPAAVESEDRGPAPSSAPEIESAGDGLFTADDVQHGRRNQLKKKPRFNLDEQEVKATTEG